MNAPLCLEFAGQHGGFVKPDYVTVALIYIIYNSAIAHRTIIDSLNLGALAIELI
ncbi:MAG: hypothetical protein WDN75_13975 [Bacteroidota bacterium]